jgi:hypothetical protein
VHAKRHVDPMSRRSTLGLGRISNLLIRVAFEHLKDGRATALKGHDDIGAVFAPVGGFNPHGTTVIHEDIADRA